MRAVLLVMLLLASAACDPLCGRLAATGPALNLVFTGPAAGTLTQATSICTHYPSQGQANFHFDGELGGKTLGLNIQIHSTYKGPGTYPVGSLLDGAGEVRLKVGDLDASSATGAGTVTVGSDGKSGTLDVNLSGVEHVTGTFACDKLTTA